MCWYKKILPYLVWYIALIVLTGCGRSETVVSIGSYQVTLPEIYTREYTTTADFAYTHTQGDDRRGTMIVQSIQKSWTNQQMDDFVGAWSYPWYEIQQVRTLMSECDVAYRRYHVRFVGDPIHDTTMYLSYVFFSESVTAMISYLTTSARDRTKRDKARAETLWCTP